MDKAKNTEVQNFLERLKKDDGQKYAWLEEMREMVFTVYGQAEERMMYGGILFSMGEDDFAGLFVRQKHVSLEFSHGFQMQDPDALLEGSGKYRRHLKIRSQEEIAAKKVLFFLKQALMDGE